MTRRSPLAAFLHRANYQLIEKSLLRLHCKPKQWKTTTTNNQPASNNRSNGKRNRLQISKLIWCNESDEVAAAAPAAATITILHEINANDVRNANLSDCRRWSATENGVGNRLKFSGIISESISRVDMLIDWWTFFEHQLPIAIWICHHQCWQELHHFRLFWYSPHPPHHSQYIIDHRHRHHHLSTFLCAILIAVAPAPV